MRSTFGRLLWLAAPFWRWMALAILLGFATVSSGIGLMATSAYLISKAAVGYRLWPVSAQPSIADLQVAIVGVRFFGISRGVFRYLERYVSHDVTFRLLAGLRVWFYRVLEPLAPARLMQFRSGDLLARIGADVDTLEDFYLRAIAPPLVAVLVALLAVGLVGSFAAVLGAILLFFLLLGGVGVSLLVRSLSHRPAQRLIEVRAELSGILVEGIQGMADLVAFGQAERFLDRVRALGSKMEDPERRITRLGGLQSALTGLLMYLAVLSVLVMAVPLVNRGELDSVYLALLVMAVLASFEVIWPLPQAAQYLEGSLEAARRLFEIADAKPAVADPPSPWPTPNTYHLEVSDLCFRYNPGDPVALNGISFGLPQGHCMAVVGPSGAGKSTLAQLLLRFWDYETGSICLAGRELREYGQEDLRSLVAVVSQQTYLFSGTVRENLLLARPEATEPEMVAAAKEARIHEFVVALPQGYDTWIGEQGWQLSGGERQRLAIARAILKNVPILILDEPTANLDAVTEREVINTLLSLVEGRTTLLFTHSLVGMENADEVLVLRGGHIVERGPHHDLVQMGGFYRRMWDVQHQKLLDNLPSWE
jgi:ATP-binding cassette subfamily C protein CydC